MKLFFLFTAVAFCALSPLSAQAPVIQWQKTIGGNYTDFLNTLQQTADGGYILGGNSTSDISGDKTENGIGAEDYWVIKLDASGDIQLQNTIGGDLEDNLLSLQQTTDGGFILGGTSFSNISGDKTDNGFGAEDYWVIKLDASGGIQWQNTIGGTARDDKPYIEQTGDGGFILGGTSFSNISGYKTENSNGGSDCWVLKLDALGYIQWQNTIGGNGYEFLKSLKQTADGGVVLGVTSSSNISGDKTENNLGAEYDYWVIKLDASGNVQWENTIGGNKDDEIRSAQQTADGGYILGGISFSNISGDKTENGIGGGDYWVLKLDASGNIQWQNTIGGNSDDSFTSLQQTSDGGFILGGYSDSNISGDKTENSLGGYDYWVLKLDGGGIQWQNTIGGNDNEGLTCLQHTSDNGYILGGWSRSNISGDKTENSNGNYDYWVIKLAPETVPTEEAPTVGSLTIYPNPATDVLFVHSEAATTLCLRNAFGQILSTQTIQGQSKIDLSTCPNGIYFLVEMETGIGHKILKNR